MGSQITELGPFKEALASIRELIGRSEAERHSTSISDFGGGLGISYNAEAPPSPQCYAAAIIEATQGLGLTVVLEPAVSLWENAVCC